MPILPENNITKIIKTFDLRSPVTVACDGGTIIGAPTFSRDGADFDGTNDYITYAIPNTLMASAKISIVMEFTPDFDWDEDVNRYLYDTTDSNRYYIYKKNNAAGNALEVYMGHAKIGDIASASYAAYWKQNERNVLVVSGENGAVNIWLNGNQIMTNDPTAWTQKMPTEFYAGVRFSGSLPFDGKIHSINIKNDLTTAQEALDLYNQSTFNFQNKSDVWLDMKSQVGKPNKINLATDMLVASWTGANNPNLTNPSPNILKIAYIDTGNPEARQTITSVGKRYKAKGIVRGNGSIKPRLTDGGVVIFTGTASTSDQAFDFVYTAAGATFRLQANASSAGFAEFEDVTLELVQQTTPDKSGKGNDFLLGDGSDTTKMPTFKNPGFDQDGGTEYFENRKTPDIYGSAETSIVICFKPDFETDEDVIRTFCDSKIADYSKRYTIQKANNASSNTLNVRLGGVDIVFIAEATYKPYWRVHGLNVIVVAGQSTATDVYLNGFKLVDADSSAWSGQIPDDVYVGSNSGGASQTVDGTIYHFSVYKQKLTPTQARVITNDLTRRYSK